MIMRSIPPHELEKRITFQHITGYACTWDSSGAAVLGRTCRSSSSSSLRLALPAEHR